MEFTAPPFSGDIRITSLHCTTEDFLSCFNELRIIQVRLPGLKLLPNSIDYDKIGSTGVSSLHSGNHYANSAMLSYIPMLAKQWKEKNPTLSKLQINDISLIYGGHFDIGNNWNGPHANHFFGNEVDIHYVGEEHEFLFRFLTKKLAGTNYRWHDVHGNHHHISFHK